MGETTTSMKSFFTFLVAAAFVLGNAANATAQAVSKPVVIGEVFQSALKAEPGNEEARHALTRLGIELLNPAAR